MGVSAPGNRECARRPSLTSPPALAEEPEHPVFLAKPTITNRSPMVRKTAGTAGRVEGRIPDFPEQCVGKDGPGRGWPVFGQTGRVVLDITARTA